VIEESSPYPPTPFITRFNIILPSTSRSPKFSLLSSYPTRILHALLIPTCTTRIFVTRFIILIICWIRTSLRKFIRPPVTCPILGLDIFPNVLPSHPQPKSGRKISHDVGTQLFLYQGVKMTKCLPLYIDCLLVKHIRLSTFQILLSHRIPIGHNILSESYEHYRLNIVAILQNIKTGPIRVISRFSSSRINCLF
jgi:hypothetical protein